MWFLCKLFFHRMKADGNRSSHKAHMTSNLMVCSSEWWCVFLCAVIDRVYPRWVWLWEEKLHAWSSYSDSDPNPDLLGFGCLFQWSGGGAYWKNNKTFLRSQIKDEWNMIFRLKKLRKQRVVSDNIHCVVILYFSELSRFSQSYWIIESDKMFV